MCYILKYICACMWINSPLFSYITVEHSELNVVSMHGYQTIAIICDTPNQESNATVHGSKREVQIKI